MRFSLSLDDGRLLDGGEFEPLAGANVLVAYRWSDDKEVLIEFVNGLPTAATSATDADVPRLVFVGDFDSFEAFLRGTSTLHDVADSLTIVSDDLAALMVASGIVQSPRRKLVWP